MITSRSLAALFVVALSVQPAFAHYAQSGCPYPSGCCNSTDCALSHSVLRTDKGYQAGNDFVPFGDSKIKYWTCDNDTHECRAPNGTLRCIIVPAEGLANRR